MDIGQAVRRLLSGDKVRREAWDIQQLIDPNDESPLEEVKLTYEDLLADDWETVDG